MLRSYVTTAPARQAARIHRARNRGAVLPDAAPVRRFAVIGRDGLVACLVSSPSAARTALLLGGL